MKTAMPALPIVFAFAYAARGWPVIPLHTAQFDASGAASCSCGNADCSSVGKHPRTVNGLHNATLDQQQIEDWWRRWPDANIGIPTGEALNMIVLDVDEGHGGRQSLAQLMDEHGEIPETLEVQTGGGGLHLWFRRDGIAIKNSTEKLGSGLDIRGDGGYIVAPPSLHRSGNRYAWIEGAGPDERTPIAMPAWMVGKLLAKPKPAQSAAAGASSNDAAQHWLGKALAMVSTGKRNATGLWLATQLRDARIGMSEAERTMCDYAARCPGGDHAYTDREALATLRGVYDTAPRDPAKSDHGPTHRTERQQPGAEPKANVTTGAAAELGQHLANIIDGTVANIPFCFEQLTRGTQALINGTVTCFVGDPGVGKTLLILQHLQLWRSLGIPYAAYFIEKDRKFHTHRLLAQLEGKGNLLNFDWIKIHPAEVDAALKRHAKVLDEIGRNIYSDPDERITLDLLLGWIRQMASAGKRIIVVDPITAVAAPKDRWTEDEMFVIQAQKILTHHGASMVVTTHAKKNRRPNAPTLDDMALGAAYSRFCDTSLWLVRQQKPREVKYQSPMGPTVGKFTTFLQIHKARNGRAAHQELAFRFGDGLQYSEQGLVLEDIRSDSDEPEEGMGTKTAAELAQLLCDSFPGKMNQGDKKQVICALKTCKYDPAKQVIAEWWQQKQTRTFDLQSIMAECKAKSANA